MDRFFAAFSHRTASFAGQPAAFILALSTIVIWIVTGPFFQWSDTWQLVINTGTTIVTFLMVFLIQNAQNRDASAMQAKLDELLRAVDGARNQFIGIEHLTQAQLEGIKSELEQLGSDEKGNHLPIERLIERR